MRLGLAVGPANILVGSCIKHVVVGQQVRLVMQTRRECDPITPILLCCMLTLSLLDVCL